MDMKEITPKIVEAEIFGWLKYLNEVIGVLCFTLGLGVLGTPNPTLFGFLSIGFVMAFHFLNRKERGALLSHLVDKKNRSELEELILKDARERISIRKAFPMMYGYCFLAVVTLGKFLFYWSPLIVSIMYGEK